MYYLQFAIIVPTVSYRVAYGVSCSLLLAYNTVNIFKRERAWMDSFLVLLFFVPWQMDQKGMPCPHHIV